VSRAMTYNEREAFLAELHVGVLGVADVDGRGPLILPIWYAYEPGGEIRFVTGQTTRKGRLIERARRVSLCVQDEAPPYKYVMVEGPVVAIEFPVSAEQRRAIAARYLGPEAADGYVAATAELAEVGALYRVRPERWLTQDFTEDFGG
jgi:nitroimidazol reductase NimA-like FMN-containing flavoprotein (pyridoxamine 5'-phosphate oxidase superfamily)